MDPWSAEVIEWDPRNEEELHPHGIYLRDIEDVFFDQPKWVPNKRGRSGDFLMIGYNRSRRALTIAVSYDQIRRALRPITGWDCTESERTRYLP